MSVIYDFHFKRINWKNVYRKKNFIAPMTHEGNFNLPFLVSIEAPVPCQCLVLVLWLLMTDESNKYIPK